ncbi:MAG: Lrp/AsnC family transcriptional regulator [Nanoarchaeota archaeon]
MKTKIKNIIFEYSRNSRITTKELGKIIGTSQQSSSYLLKSLKKKKFIIGNTTIVDSVKLGYINVIVGFNFLNPNVKKDILDELLEISEIISIEEGKEGTDLLVEYATKNLSAFNKIHSDIIYKFFTKLKAKFVFPIIVSHEYHRNYLSKKFNNLDIILSGDRLLRELSKKEYSVLIELIKNPDKKLIDMAESLKTHVKSIVRIKKDLERKYIIKGYSTILDHNKLGINRQIIFLKFSSEGIRELDKFTAYAKNNKNILKFIKIIGEYQAAIYVEYIKDIEVINDIRSNFQIDNYFTMKSEKIHKKNYLPLE